jgi:hypothetical protein
MQTLGVLARLGSAELGALVGGAIFMAIIGFFLFWGGPPKRQQ